MYGREEDRDRIIDFWVRDAFRDEETTLSQLIFNHERVINHFERRLWVCASEYFSLKTMTKVITQAVSLHVCEDLDIDPRQRKLQICSKIRSNFLFGMTYGTKNQKIGRV